MEASIRRELFGPTCDGLPEGRPLDISHAPVTFASYEESRGLFHDYETGEEILSIGPPLSRYGVGVLHGGGSVGGTPLSNLDTDLSGVDGFASDGFVGTEETPEIAETTDSSDLEPETDSFSLADANRFKPSAMGISFQCRVSASGFLAVTVSGARYDAFSVHISKEKRSLTWWVRRPFTLTGRIPGHALSAEGKLRRVAMEASHNPPAILPQVNVYSRRVPNTDDPALRLVTISVVNISPPSGDKNLLFQMGFSVEALDGLEIKPYPEPPSPGPSEEEESLDLLYRKKQTFATGHGCAAEWRLNGSGEATRVHAVAMPAYEVMSLTPDIYQRDDEGNLSRDEHGKPVPLIIGMKDLAEGNDKGSRQIEKMLHSYENWIRLRRDEIPSLPKQMQPAAHRHMLRAETALQRMRAGWDLTQTSEIAGQAFRWANEAMADQQARVSLPLRKIEATRNGLVRPAGDLPAPTLPPGKGNWRPFQIAFILATLPEVIDPSTEYRSTVDLIFFPTGGGKTEAYLGVTAVSLLTRRLKDPSDAGTDTIMRYTLRLLTAQQFVRAASLICALEEIRSNNPTQLGTTRFSIGIWVGSGSTPNRREQALKDLAQLGRDRYQQNPFLLLRCPWCATQMGVLFHGNKPFVAGYTAVGKEFQFLCFHPKCKFSRKPGLPVYVIDEDIYDHRPSMIIGTVDKFAMLAWRPEARSIFGFDSAGDRVLSPPGLIIQDELHLISGPLGSMVGLYEPIIDELCTDRREGGVVRPKIIASTATIRSYEEQVKGLYGRDSVALFPPQGLEEGHSFFAEPDLHPDGTPKPGRRYLGVFSAAIGSFQTVLTRSLAALTRAPLEIPQGDRDGYWTNLSFFNSLRELGNATSLLQSNIPDRLKGFARRDDVHARLPTRILELTSRVRSDEIPQAIEELQVAYSPGAKQQQAVDICLASNIIEVGIDIDRLALMTISGQPKTTAQYIQVSGRVGRRPDVSPGLVVTVYGPGNPRDRSHYERFTTYHQSLYAQVEPTSVTPFTSPVLKRALHAAAIAYIRQSGDQSRSPFPFPENDYRRAVAILRERAEIVDQREISNLDEVAKERERSWKAWERSEWDASQYAGDNEDGLMRVAGTPSPKPEDARTNWDVPMSMRNVDAECHIKISTLYARAEAESGESA